MRDPLRARFRVPLALAEHLAPNEQRYDTPHPRMASGNWQNAVQRDADQPARAAATFTGDPILARLLARRITNRKRTGRRGLIDPRYGASVDNTLADSLIGARHGR